MQVEKAQQVKIQLLKCRSYCDGNCIGMENRHYPFKGTLETIPITNYNSVELIRLDLMLGPNNKLYNSALPELKIPQSYRYHTSVHEGSEQWSRYYWWNGRMPQLAQGDVLQEVYRVSAPASLKVKDLMAISPESDKYFKTIDIYRNFLIIEDNENTIKMRSMGSVPKDPMRLLRKPDRITNCYLSK